MSRDTVTAALEKSTHERLLRWGRLGETVSGAIDRALDEAGAPPAPDPDEVDERDPERLM